jgi:hypothetical protein
VSINNKKSFAEQGVVMSHCVRSLTFTIPDPLDGAGVQVTVTEEDGKLIFVVQVLETSGKSADLRGLFFNVKDSALPGLSVTETEPLITDTKIAPNSVLDLGHGANMKGAVKDGFDVGIKFGTPGVGKDDVEGPVTFTLEATGDLTLDDIAHMQFGARTTSSGSKMTVTAPAAPDAVDDDFDIFEDGQSGLDDPSNVSEGELFDVLANDTDADADTLDITEVHQGAHGTVEIIQGVGGDPDRILYTPDLDFSGEDTFEYCITDNNGGTDFAAVTVAIEAVADVPDLDVQVQAGDTVNQIRLTVTATQTDADSSEFIDRFLINELDLPVGVTLAPLSLNPGAEPDQIVQEYLLTLPLNTDTDFDLTFTAVSKETSNGDEESASETIDIVFEHNTTTTPAEFTAADQSIWSTGNEFTFEDNRFVGLDTGPFDESVGTTLFAGIDGDIRIGFESKLTFEGGEIDATAEYDVTVETNYNKTTDQLLIDTSAMLTDASFITEGPSGTYKLDFVWDVLLHAFAGINIDFGSIDFDPLGIIPGDQTLDLGGINEQVNVNVDIGPGSFNVLDLDSATLSETTIEFPAPLDAFSVNLDWPDITTDGALPPEPVIASGSSNNFLELVIDMDQLLTQLLGLPVNPLHPLDLTAGPFFADIDLLDVDVIGGLNFLQQFEMDLGGLSGFLVFEDGSIQPFNIGDSLLISDASQKDSLLSGGDGDGLVEFAFAVDPSATLSNETDLGFNIGVAISLFSVELGYDITIPNPFGPDQHLSDSIQLGPLAGFSGTAPVADINVFDETFNLNFASQDLLFQA